MSSKPVIDGMKYVYQGAYTAASYQLLFAKAGMERVSTDYKATMKYVKNELENIHCPYNIGVRSVNFVKSVAEKLDINTKSGILFMKDGAANVGKYSRDLVEKFKAKVSNVENKIDRVNSQFLVRMSQTLVGNQKMIQVDPNVNRAVLSETQNTLINLKPKPEIQDILRQKVVFTKQLDESLKQNQEALDKLIAKDEANNKPELVAKEVLPINKILVTSPNLEQPVVIAPVNTSSVKNVHENLLVQGKNNPVASSTKDSGNPVPIKQAEQHAMSPSNGNIAQALDKLQGKVSPGLATIISQTQSTHLGDYLHNIKDKVSLVKSNFISQSIAQDDHSSSTIAPNHVDLKAHVANEIANDYYANSGTTNSFDKFHEAVMAGLVSEGCHE